MEHPVGTLSGPAVETQALSKTFRTGRGRRSRSVVAVSHIDLVVEPGERLAYIGPNGAGKSTSIKMLTGILHPTSGSATVLGMVPWRERRQLTRCIGTLFGQRSQLWSELSSKETFWMLGAIYGLDRRAVERRVAELGELLDAADLYGMPVRSLSLGQRMRCELSACLLHEPSVLFLDEPTIGLDLLAKQRFRELLVRLNAEAQITIFMTSHDVADIEQVARRAVVVNHGAVIYDDLVSTMRRTLLSTKVVEATLSGPLDLGRLDGRPGLSVLEHTASGLRVEVDVSTLGVRELLDHLVAYDIVTDITVTDPPLERVIAEI
jgi:ABC-2 type transport system ATP-binding protein